jgi:hypothetical protein
VTAAFIGPAIRAWQLGNAATWLFDHAFPAQYDVNRRDLPSITPSFADSVGYWDLRFRAESPNPNVKADLLATPSDAADTKFMVDSLVDVWPDLSDLELSGYTLYRGRVPGESTSLCESDSCKFYALASSERAFVMILRD